MTVPTSPTLRGDDLETWSAFATVLEWLPAALDAQLLADAGLSHFEYGVMFALANAPERALRMSVLAGFANSSLSRLSRAVLRLEKRGWVVRTPDPGDGRYTLATLTEQGVEKTDASAPGHVAAVNRLVLGSLSPAQRRQLLEISRRITRAIRDEDGWLPAN